MITSLRCLLAVFLLITSAADVRAEPATGAPGIHTPAAVPATPAAATASAAPTVFDLWSQRPGARAGRITAGTDANGLVVTGTVDGPAPHFPAAAAGMSDADHVELWLAAATRWGSPPIGWGNAFEDRTLVSEQDCNAEDGSDDSASAEDCRLWYRAQQRYREKFDRLLIRQWQLAPRLAVETFATPAFRALTPDQQQSLRILKPIGTPTFAATPAPEGYSFTIHVPWAALPPANTLVLTRVHLMVDVYSPGAEPGKEEPFASTARDHDYGEPDRFATMPLNPPRRYHVTPCNYPLQARNSRDDRDLPAFYLPTTTDDIRTIFVVENPVIGDRDPSSRSSPGITITSFTVRDLAPAAFACGPTLAIRNGDKVLRSDAVLDGTFTVLPLGPRRWLAKFGPTIGDIDNEDHWPCGRCSSLDLSMAVFDLDTGPRIVFSESRPFDDDNAGSSQHFELSPDWRRITFFKTRRVGATTGVSWRREDWCLPDERGSYITCNIPAPPAATAVPAPSAPPMP